jgi:GR25 family glycosyltransferase involved in LPS biosynthesis
LRESEIASRGLISPHALARNILGLPVIFLISLARATQRRIDSLNILRRAGFAFELVDAHDGHLEPDLPRHPECWSMRPTEVAAFYSHARAMKRVLDQGLPYGVILEDDFEFRAGFDLAWIKSHLPADCDFASLHDLVYPGLEFEIASHGPKFHRLQRYGLMTVGYLVSARFVQHFFDHCMPCRLPIDHQFRELSETTSGLAFYQATDPKITGRGVDSTL